MASLDDLYAQYLEQLVAPVQAPTYTAPDLNTVNPYLDPTYNAFMRVQGMSEAQQQAATARQQERLEQQLMEERPVWEQKATEGDKKILDSSANRGLARSGNDLNRRATYAQDLSKQQSDYESGIRDQQASLSEQNDASNLDRQRQQAENESAARQRVAQQQLEQQVSGY